MVLFDGLIRNRFFLKVGSGSTPPGFATLLIMPKYNVQIYVMDTCLIGQVIIVNGTELQLKLTEENDPTVANRQVLPTFQAKCSILLYVQELLTLLCSNLLYKIGHYFLDRR